MPFHVPIFLPAACLRTLHREAFLRQESKERKHIDNGIYDESRMTPRGAHEIGLRSEEGVSRYFAVPRERKIFKRRGDKGPDVFITDFELGATSIKTADGDKYRNDPLLKAEVEHDTPLIDSYLLVLQYPRCPYQVELVGWLPRAEVINRVPEKLRQDPRFPENYVVEEHELRPMPLSNKVFESYDEYLRTITDPLVLKSFKRDVRRVMDECRKARDEGRTTF